MKKKLLAVFGLVAVSMATFQHMNAQAFTEDFNDITTLPGSGWYAQNNSTTVGSTGWFQGNPTVFAAYNGATDDYLGANYNNTTAANTISNWYCMPNVTIRNGDVISFWTRKSAPDTYPDRLELRMSTNGASTNVGPLGNATAVGDFTTLLTSVNPALVTGVYPTVWTLYTVTISGLPAPTSGRFAFRYFVTNGGPSGANSDYIGIDNVVYTPYVCPTLTVSPGGTLAAGTTGVIYSQNLSQTGALGTPTFSVIAGSLPPGLTMSTAGVISGTPTTPGTYNFTTQVADNSGCTGSQAMTIVVSCPTVNITPGSITTPTVGTSYNQTLIGSGGSGPYSFSVTSGSLPAGLTLSTGGVISGTPTSSGVYGFTVTATDLYGCTSSITYNGSTVCPSMSISPGVLPSINLGVFYNQNLSTSGGTAGYSYAVTGGALPSGLTLTTGGNISGTPGVAGSYNFTVTVTDLYGCTTSASYNGNVTCPGLSITPGSLPNGTLAVVYNETLSTSGGSGSYTYTVTSGSLPPGLTLSSGGNISGTPTLAGNYSFTITSTDGFGCNTFTSYNVTIGCPSITLSPSSLPDGNSSVAYNQSMSTSGGAGGYSYSVTSGALPGGLTLTTGGVLSGTPNALGTFNFDITSTDAGGCAVTNSYTITITCATSFVTLAPFTTSACSNGGLVALSGGTPAGGTYSGTGVTGGFFNPSAGTQLITYSFTDGQGCSDNDAQTLTVNTSPSVGLSASELNPCVSYADVTLTGTPSGGNYFGSAALTGNMFDPSSAGVGTHIISYSYMDVGTGCSDTAQVTINVSACAGIEDEFDNQISVYPNPAEAFINIDFGTITNQQVEIILYSTDGKLLMKRNVLVESNQQTEVLDITTIASGNYIIRISDSMGHQSQRKFVKK